MSLAESSLKTLKAVEQRVLWLAIRIVDAANRRSGGEVRVGGHQASSASMASIMTALWFGHLGTEDKVAVKPQASPVCGFTEIVRSGVELGTYPKFAVVSGSASHHYMHWGRK